MTRRLDCSRWMALAQNEPFEPSVPGRVVLSSSVDGLLFVVDDECSLLVAQGSAIKCTVPEGAQCIFEAPKSAKVFQEAPVIAGTRSFGRVFSNPERPRGMGHEMEMVTRAMRRWKLEQRELLNRARDEHARQLAELRVNRLPPVPDASDQKEKPAAVPVQPEPVEGAE